MNSEHPAPTPLTRGVHKRSCWPLLWEKLGLIVAELQPVQRSAPSFDIFWLLHALTWNHRMKPSSLAEECSLQQEICNQDKCILGTEKDMWVQTQPPPSPQLVQRYNQTHLEARTDFNIACTFSSSEQVIIKAGRELKTKSGTTQSKWGPQSVGGCQSSWLLPSSKMISKSLVVLVFLLKTSSSKIYIGRQEGIQLPNLNEAGFFFFCFPIANMINVTPWKQPGASSFWAFQLWQLWDFFLSKFF